MKPVVVFAVGAVVGAAVALLALQATSDEDEAGGRWRERAEQAERDLALERRKTATMTTQIGELAKRFDALAARLETLSSAAAEAFRAPAGEGAPTPPAPAEQP